MPKSTNGFTIVELLIVIVVIAILAAITVVAYNGVQDRAKNSQISSDLAMFKKAFLAAKISTGRNIVQISGTSHTGGSCFGVDNTYPGDFESSHGCWTRYHLTVDRIAAAANMNLDSLKDGDPHGAPYYIDENEGENYSSQGLCRIDVVGTYTNPLPPSRNGYGLAAYQGATGGYNWLDNLITVPAAADGC